MATSTSDTSSTSFIFNLKNNDSLFLPTRANPTDAGYDVRAYIKGDPKLSQRRQDLLKKINAYLVEPFDRSPLHDLFLKGFDLVIDGKTELTVKPGIPVTRGLKFDESGESKHELTKALGQIDKDFIILLPGESAVIPLGFKVALPKPVSGLLYSYMQLHARSGLSIKHGLVLKNQTGIIDSGYRDEVKAAMMNQGKNIFVITHGTRIAQAIFSSCYDLNAQADLTKIVSDKTWENSFQDLDNRGGGLGHTGTN